jgi:cysteinyl-tRNA synthetase
MPLVFYNTLSRSKEEFKPIREGEVSFYSCGPTVHDYAHIGNFRAALTFDLIKRYLKYRGYAVRHVMNITDVEDKIITKVKDQGLSLSELTTRYAEIFLDQQRLLNIEPADEYPKATDHIPEMVELIQGLVEDGYAYKRDDSVYFSIDRFPDYGKLANLDVEGMQSGASGVDTDEYYKDNVRDFALWKGWKEEDGEVFWNTDLGKGRPGWHLECSCLSMKYLGETIDIHAGGIDLIFPHHQNEIAQSEAATGKRFVNYWLHNAFLNINDEKMSKSLNNFYTLSDIVQQPDDARAFRWLIVSSHYRTTLNFSEEVLTGAKSTMRRLNNFRARLVDISIESGGEDVAPLVEQAHNAFVEHMDDDLNSPRAVAALFDFVNAVEVLVGDDRLDTTGAAAVLALLDDVDRVLGVFYTLPEDETPEESLSDDLLSLIQEREQARKDRNFARSDEIRDQLLAHGITLEDTPDGTLWHRQQE